jgi:hypothetical protein
MTREQERAMSKYVDVLPERSHTVLSKRRPEVRPVSDQALPLLAPSAILQRATLAVESLRPVEVVRMQQTLGNRAVGELLGHSSSSRPRIQAKLTVNAPGDEYEREADRVAEQVMHMPAVERAELEDEDEELEVMTKREPAHGVSGAFEAGEEFEQQLNSTRGQGQPLPSTLKQEFETRFGADFSRVRIHTDVRSAEMNRAIQARAFTHGQDIYLGAGQYSTDSTGGKRLLAHELTHVVQQNNNELQANPRHNGRSELRDGMTSEGMGHNLKRLDRAHSSLVLNRTTPLIQPKRTLIPDKDWSEYLLNDVTDEKKRRVEKNYDDSQARGERIKVNYEQWKSKTLEQQVDKRGSTRTFRSKGYTTDIESSSAGQEFSVKTYRKMASLFTLDEFDSLIVQSALEGGDKAKIKEALKSRGHDTYGDLEIKEMMATKPGIFWEGSTPVWKNVTLPEWQIRDKGETGTKSNSGRYGRTYVARIIPNHLDDTYSILEFYGFEKTPTQKQLEQANLGIPYTSTYSLSAGKFTAQKNFKDSEQDQTFAEGNSEIIWNQYKSAIKQAKSVSGGQDLKYAGNLGEIERNTIINDQTLDTIFFCDGGGKVLNNRETSVVLPESADFWALIGTPNGISAGWLIIDHGTALGLQSLESIEYQRMRMNIKYKKR